MCLLLSVTYTNPHLTSSPLSPTLLFSLIPHLISILLSMSPASCTLLLLSSLQSLCSPPILTNFGSVSLAPHSFFFFSSLFPPHLSLSVSFIPSLSPSSSLSSLLSLPLSFSLLSLPCRLRGDLLSQRSHDHQPYRFPATPDVLIPSRSISSEV